MNCVFFRTLPNISKEEFELIFEELDDTHDVKVVFVLYCFGYLLYSLICICMCFNVTHLLYFQINKDEFADICNAIALKFQKEDAVSSSTLNLRYMKVHL